MEGGSETGQQGDSLKGMFPMNTLFPLSGGMFAIFLV